MTYYARAIRVRYGGQVNLYDIIICCLHLGTRKAIISQITTNCCTIIVLITEAVVRNRTFVIAVTAVDFIVFRIFSPRVVLVFLKRSQTLHGWIAVAQL